jgi:hypothetical protein
LGVGEGVVHDGHGRNLIKLRRNNRPRRRRRGVLVGANDIEECTSKCRLVSCEIENRVPQSEPSTPWRTWGLKITMSNVTLCSVIFAPSNCVVMGTAGCARKRSQLAPGV